MKLSKKMIMSIGTVAVAIFALSFPELMGPLQGPIEALIETIAEDYGTAPVVPEQELPLGGE